MHSEIVSLLQCSMDTDSSNLRGGKRKAGKMGRQARNIVFHSDAKLISWQQGAYAWNGRLSGVMSVWTCHREALMYECKECKVMQDRYYRAESVRSASVSDTIYRRVPHRGKLAKCKAVHGLLFINVSMQVRLWLMTFHDMMKCRTQSKHRHPPVRMIWFGSTFSTFLRTRENKFSCRSYRVLAEAMAIWISKTRRFSMEQNVNE